MSEKSATMGHNHEDTTIKIDGSCPRCNKTSMAVDSVLANHSLVATETGFSFDPPLDGQELVDAVQQLPQKARKMTDNKPEHDHTTVAATKVCEACRCHS